MNIGKFAHAHFTRIFNRRPHDYPTVMTLSKEISIMILVIGLLGSEIAWKVWKYLISERRRLVDGQKDVIAEVFVFSERTKMCREHSSTGIPCDEIDCPVASVRKLQRYLITSKTLDVCMYIMTADDLTSAIIKSHRQGACVRMIVDSSMSNNSGCSVQLLRIRRAGIQVRMNRSDPASFMHHKFALIDGKILLFGSTNWTMQAFYGNNDSIVATNLEELVERYTSVFEKMWADFE